MELKIGDHVTMINGSLRGTITNITHFGEKVEYWIDGKHIRTEQELTKVE